MRKLLILLLLVPMMAKAQVGEYRSDFAVGVNGGYTMSQVSFQPDVPEGWLGGMIGGVSFRYTCEKYFKSICAIVAEVNYAQMGWKETIEDKDNNPVYYYDDENKENPLYYERRINYIQIPVMARMGWGRERKGVQAFFQLGPQIGIYLDESTNTNIESFRPTQTPRSSVVTAQEGMPVEKKFDYGIVGGAGIEFSLPKIGHILLEGRYYFGLGNIYGNTKQDYFGKSNQQAIVIKMSYLYDIFKTKNSNIK
ncbi:MAG: PorT family protein [Prevotella sp.]|jgi:hypothetical protein|nr:PorT family protein [Prevotella sp.]